VSLRGSEVEVAGSYDHICEDDGSFTMDFIENMGDAHEALEECHEIIERLREEARWVRAKLGLPKDAPFARGRGATLCGKLHVLEDQARVYTRYIAAGKCDDKSGEIARQSAEIIHLQNQLHKHACSCTGTETAESGHGLEPERHEAQCGYRLALIPSDGVET
jgi:hypothetical protein